MRLLNDKLQEGRIRQYGQVRMEVGYIGQRMLDMKLPGEQEEDQGEDLWML